MDIPYEILLGFIFGTMAMSIIGVWKQIPLMMFIGGAIITFLIVITDNIIMGIMPDTSSVSGSTTTYTLVNDLYPLDQWVKILFALMGSVFMLGGALIWKAIED